MSVYKGAASEGNRAAQLLRAREEQRAEMERQKLEIERESKRSSASMGEKVVVACYSSPSCPPFRSCGGAD
jgi:hypothetical protein